MKVLSMVFISVLWLLNGIAHADEILTITKETCLNIEIFGEHQERILKSGLDALTNQEVSAFTGENRWKQIKGFTKTSSLPIYQSYEKSGLIRNFVSSDVPIKDISEFSYELPLATIVITLREVPDNELPKNVEAWTRTIADLKLIAHEINALHLPKVEQFGGHADPAFNLITLNVGVCQ